MGVMSTRSELRRREKTPSEKQRALGASMGVGHGHGEYTIICPLTFTKGLNNPLPIFIFFVFPIFISWLIFVSDIFTALPMVTA